MFVIERKRNYSNQINTPKILILQGISGTGKTLIANFLKGKMTALELIRIVEKYPRHIQTEMFRNIMDIIDTYLTNFNIFSKLVTTTTRQKRKGEIDGVDYNFVDKDTFEKYIKENKMVEYVVNFGNYYGISKYNLEQVFNSNNNVVAILDIEGVKKLKDLYGNKIVAVHLKLDKETMIERLKERNTDNDELQKRIKEAELQIGVEQIVDYVIDSDRRFDFVLRDILNILFKNFMLKKQKIRFENKIDIIKDFSIKNKKNAL